MILISSKSCYTLSHYKRPLWKVSVCQHFRRIGVFNCGEGFTMYSNKWVHPKVVRATAPLFCLITTQLMLWKYNIHQKHFSSNFPGTSTMAYIEHLYLSFCYYCLMHSIKKVEYIRRCSITISTISDRPLVLRLGFFAFKMKKALSEQISAVEK